MIVGNNQSFTFQYVSIISCKELREIGETDIYIPICFYYFYSPITSNAVSNELFTFQYVSIISIRFRKELLQQERFTFQYVSIISSPNCTSHSKAKGFTFQYVSIISPLFLSSGKSSSQFTFQYVSIISGKHYKFHSLNFIYIPICFYYLQVALPAQVLLQLHLHSNMFLLFPGCSSCAGSSATSFTFQYVCIISITFCLTEIFCPYLHSNMFLLFRRYRRNVEKR